MNANINKKYLNENKDDWGFFLNFDESGNILSHNQSIFPLQKVIIKKTNLNNILNYSNPKLIEKKNISFSCFIFNKLYTCLCMCNSFIFDSEESLSNLID